MTQDVRTENDALIEVAKESARIAAGPTEVEPGRMYAFPTPDGVHLVDLDTGSYRDRLPAPRRKTGTVTVTDVNSFAAYWNKHHDDGSEVYVDIDAARITAVLNAHTAGAPRYGDHRLVLQLQTTKAWKDWTGHDRRAFEQVKFAEFLEDHLADIREPAAAAMLEVAQTFQAKTTVKFASATPLQSGDCRLTFEETTEATAGAKGSLSVPTRFKIAIPALELPVTLEEGETWPVYGIEARFRFRVNRGELTMLYLLDDPAPVLRDAVLDVVGRVENLLGITVLRGTAA